MIVVCCGMPRSGSTLQFNVVWQVAEAAGTGGRVDWRIGSDWERRGEHLAAMAEDERLHVLKMHALPDVLRRLAETSGGVRFVYVHRDIRDVVASLRIKFGYGIPKAIRRLGESVALEGWLAVRPEGEVLVQDYALLLTALPEAVREVADFLGARLPEAEVARIAGALGIDRAYVRSRARKVAFEGVRRRLNFLLGRGAVFADRELMLHPEHVSEHRGQIGIWRERLSPPEIEAIEEALGPRIRSGFRG